MESDIVRELIDTINGEYRKRKEKRPSYSLRAFAKHLGVDASHLLKFLQGKKGLSRDRLISLGQRLGMDNLWVNRAQFFSSRGKKPREIFREVDEAKFQKIYQWYHMAIYELPFIRGFKPDPRWIAETLEISLDQADDALASLNAAGLIDFVHNEKTKESIRNPFSWSTYYPGQTSAERRENQKQFLNKAISALEQIPVEWREQSSMVMATDAKNLQKARLLTKKFRRDMSRLLSRGSNCKNIYAMSISLFPITRNFSNA